ncbi:uncharacterized protein LOC114328083 isoform X5 [Diabrotica virgifera virgifera]|uniref:Uncharacterized protein LOC114328083 isoform X5 n=1 Tax=Diabrotica virgifera virgifera TaxID=50390 RepID=A0A6P7FHI3_DIAVI|nr:uncharacterized protein LOC114328083 isoform X5 [Diabrotica virgifera virgifera]
MCTLNRPQQRHLVSDDCSCPIPIGNSVCGETKTLDIINEFKRLYEEKMQEIDNTSCGDCLQEKMQLQQNWIGDLTEQNEMLVRAVEDLELEATERVKMLEEKLQRSAECICEVMKKYRENDIAGSLLDEPRKRIFNLENDMTNVLEFLRRIREEKRWNTEGLNFIELTEADLLGSGIPEDINQYLNYETLKAERRSTEKDSTIQKLEAKIDELNSMTKEFQMKKDECENLQKNMIDMRQALTEEVATKHDTVLKLKRECQELEERCIQADKQTAFRDDIIKELRKEIKQLKQQVTHEEVEKLNNTIEELRNTLQESKTVREKEDQEKHVQMTTLNEEIQRLGNCLCEANAKLQEKDTEIFTLNRTIEDFQYQYEPTSKTKVQTDGSEPDEEQLQKLIQRDELIKYQADTLRMLQQELQRLKEKDKEFVCDREMSEENCDGICYLEQQVELIKGKLVQSENRVEELTREIDNKEEIIKSQKDTLNFVEKQLDILRSKESEMRIDNEHQCACIQQLKSRVTELETSTQDAERRANNLQMATMSNDTAQEENSKLMSAFVRVQELNQQLTIQLAAAEQKVVLENQMNQLNETKISELERMVSSKEIDIDKHSVTITNIKENLVCSLQQNEALQKTITSLSETVYEFHQCVQKYENDSCKSKEVTIVCQNQIESCKEKLIDLKDLLERKTSDLCKIEMAYNNQHRSLMCCQMELKEIKDRQKNKQYYLKCVIEELKDKLNKSEEERNKQTRELKLMQEDLGSLKRKNEKKDADIGRYRRIISDLKRTLTELNKNLSKKEIPFRSKCNREECRRYIEQFNETDLEVLQNQEAGTCVNCPCEVDFYRNVVEALKRAVNEIKIRLTSTQKKNKDLEKELRDKELQVQEISKTQIEKDKEYNELKQKLMERLQMVQGEETKFTEKSKQFEKEVASLKRELELKTLQLNEVEKSTQQIAGNKSIQLVCAQEEINVLKEQLNKLLRQHCAVNMENEKLHTQSTRMQTTVTNLEERSQLLKGQVEQYLVELQVVQKEKDSLHIRNQDLLRELRALQTSYDQQSGQQRYNEEAIKSLESELKDVKKNRDDIYLESRTVVDYFRLWLQEQKKINEFTVSKERDYFKTIEMLKQQNHGPSCPFVQSPFTRNISNLRNRQEHCQSPWSLGSQGTSSVHDGSPCRSPCINEGSDWYATNFRNDSEDDEVEEDDDDWVTKVENLAAQVRKTNKMWRHKMEKADLTVTKDTKK